MNLPNSLDSSKRVEKFHLLVRAQKTQSGVRAAPPETFEDDGVDVISVAQSVFHYFGQFGRAFRRRSALLALYQQQAYQVGGAENEHQDAGQQKAVRQVTARVEPVNSVAQQQRHDHAREQRDHLFR